MNVGQQASEREPEPRHDTFLPSIDPVESCRLTMKMCSLTSRPGRKMLWTAALGMALLSHASQPGSTSELAQQGEDLAQRLCGACHGIGRAERSPVSVAPAFRRIEPRVDLDQMIERLQNGLVAGHPEMPVFVLKENEARALVAYMRSLQSN